MEDHTDSRLYSTQVTWIVCAMPPTMIRIAITVLT